MTVSAQFPAETLTKHRRHAAALERVRQFIDEHPEASVRDVMHGCGLRSTGHTFLLLKKVKAELCACPTCGGSGSIRTTAPVAGAPGAVFPQAHRRGT